MSRQPEAIPCEDFEAVGGDALEVECTCGHVIEEHERGFFMPCKICGPSDDEDSSEG